MDCNHFPPRQSVDVNQMLTHLLAIPKVQTPLILLQILDYFTLTLLQNCKVGLHMVRSLTTIKLGV